MSNKRITDLTELTNPTTDDVFPIVDIATNTTQKVQVGNLPIQTAVTTALATKQATLVSATNIKTINSTSVLGAGNIAVQETLVSGTNIKTLNSVSLLGSGDIVLAATPSGVAGAIQFSNGSAFASDAANIFWDNTNKRLGIGTNALDSKLRVVSGSNELRIGFLGGIDNYIDAGSSSTGTTFMRSKVVISNDTKIGELSTPAARLHIVGSGSTSATTSLLVQNSAGTNILKIGDSAKIDILGTIGMMDFSSYYNISSSGNGSTVGCFITQQAFSVQGNRLCVNVASSSHFNSASFQVDSTTTGVLFPRMTTTQKNAIASPAAGLVVYDNTTNKLQCYNGSTWNDLF